jgi:hypothetical protein
MTATAAPRAAAFRVLALTLLAALVYGGWAFAVNLQHGAAPALRAGCLQGVSSATTTLVMSSAVERLYAARAGRPLRRLVAWLAPASLGACLHVSIHVLAGTPEILITILPSVVLGAVFAGLYVLGLMRAAATGGARRTTS